MFLVFVVGFAFTCLCLVFGLFWFFFVCCGSRRLVKFNQSLSKIHLTFYLSSLSFFYLKLYDIFSFLVCVLWLLFFGHFECWTSSVFLFWWVLFGLGCGISLFLLLKIADLTLSLWISAGEWCQEPIAEALVVPPGLMILAMSLLVTVPLVMAIARGCCYGSRSRDRYAMPLSLGHAGCKATLIRIPNSGHTMIATLCPPRNARMLGSSGCGVGVVTTVVGLGTRIQGQQGKTRLGGQRKYICDLI